MNVSLYQAASALSANSRLQDIIAENLAGSSVPGFKRHDLSFSAVEAGLKTGGGAGAGRGARSAASTYTSFAPGEMKYTGAPTDAALEGSGFFSIQLPDGSKAYTRDGEFQMNAQGQLVTKQGHLVLGENGPIQLDVRNSNPLSVSHTGEISQGGEIRGRLKLVEFNDPRLLREAAGGLYLEGNPDLVGKPAANTTLRQGWIEGSNVVPVVEMANLMTSMRGFEANQRIIQIQDERLGKAISEIVGS